MGGGEINLALVAETLAKLGKEVVVLTSYQPGLKKSEIIMGVRIYRNLTTGRNPHLIIQNWKRSLFFPKSIVKEVKKICRTKKFDLIHFIGASVIAAKDLAPLKIPLFATIESYPALCPKGDRMYNGKAECPFVCSFNKFRKCQRKSSEIGKMKHKWYLKYNPLFCNYLYNYYRKLNTALKYCRLIAISNYVKDLLEKQGLESVTIFNAFDFSEKTTKKNKIKNNPPKILYLGSLTNFKGPQILLQALKGLPYRCDLYGEGPLKNELNQYIIKNNLNAAINNPVPPEKLKELYLRYDLVVYPSLWPEPFGRIPIEALSKEIPILASKIGAISETVQSNPFLFEPGNILQLNQKIKEILNPREKIGFKLKILRDNYSKENIIRKLLVVYQNNIKDYA
ncbi:glycosyltransferase [Candidatus Woesearchaeota archaeon]|nr:glycosyltransferase [Candidatus Woesearchaeota archaeon]